MTEVRETSICYNTDTGPLFEKDVLPWLYPKQEIVSLRDFDLSKVKSFELDDLPIVEVI